MYLFEFEEGYLVDGILGEPQRKPIVLIANIIKVPHSEVVVPHQSPQAHLLLLVPELVHLLQFLHHQPPELRVPLGGTGRHLREVHPEELVDCLWAELGDQLGEGEKEEGVEELATLQRVLENVVLVLYKYEQDPQQGLHLPGRLLRKRAVVGGDALEDHPILLVYPVVEADLPYFFPEPQWRLPPLLSLPGQRLQKQLPGAGTHVPHDAFDGDTRLGGESVEGGEGCDLGRDGCSCENGVVPLLALDIADVFGEEALDLGHEGGVQAQIALEKQPLGVLHVHVLFEYWPTNSQHQSSFSLMAQSNHMIEKQAQHLMHRLTQLKSAGNAQGQRVKQLHSAFSEYRPKITQQMHFLDSKIAQVEQELQAIDHIEQSQGHEAIGKVKNFQTSLRQLLVSYTSQAKKANQKLDEMVTTVRNEMRDSYQVGVEQQKNLLSGYKRISQQLEVLTGEVRNRQKESQQHFVYLDDVINQATEKLAVRRRSIISSLTQQYDQILAELQELEQSSSKKLDLLIQRRQAQAQNIEKVVHLTLRQSTQWPLQ